MLLWILTALCLFAFLQGKAYGLLALYRLSFLRSLDRKAVFEGQWVQLTEVIHNNKPLALPWLRVECRLSPYLCTPSLEKAELVDDRFFRGVYTPGPYEKITRTYSLLCLRRGYYDLSATALSAGDLFGLSQAYRNCVSADAVMTVYPTPAAAGAVPKEVLRWQGDIAVRRWIDPDPILMSGIREYRPGDNRRDIHWKSSAKTGILQVKTYEYTVSPKLLLVFDIIPQSGSWGKLSDSQRDSMESVIRVLAYLSQWALGNGYEAGLYSNGSLAGAGERAVELSPARSPGQYERILEALARLVFTEKESFLATMKKIGDMGLRQTDVLVFCASPDKRVLEQLERLHAMGNNVTFMDYRREAVDFEKQAQ